MGALDAVRLRLRRELLGVRSGDVSVERVTIDEESSREDGRRYLVEVVLAPPIGAETWPAHDFFTVRSEVRRRATSAFDPMDVHITYVAGADGDGDDRAEVFVSGPGRKRDADPVR